MKAPKPCPFCALAQERIIDRSAHGLICRDAFPASPGHTLVIPHRHVGSFFDLTPDERADLLGLLDQAKADVDQEFKPQGCNIGVNDGLAAGQTVPHLHHPPDPALRRRSRQSARRRALDLPRESRLLERAMTPAPSAGAQLAFLAKLQRPFADGDRVPR